MEGKVGHEITNPELLCTVPVGRKLAHYSLMEI